MDMASGRDTQIRRLRELAGRQRFQDALSGYRGLCQHAPYDADLWLERADVAEAAGYIDDAAEALFHVVDLYAQAGMGEAIEVARRLLELDAEHQGALRFLRAHAAERRFPSPGADEPPAPVAQAADDAIPEPIDDVIPLVVPASTSVPVAIPIADSIPIPLPESHSVAMPRPHPGLFSGPVAKPSAAAIAAADARANADVRAAASARAAASPRRSHGRSHTDRQRAVVGLLSRLERSPLLDILDLDGISQMAERGHLRHIDRGQSVFRQGEGGTSLYLLLEGSVDVERYHPVLGTVVRLSTLRAGSFFGEQSLIAGGGRSATVRARRQSAVLEVGRDTVRMLGRRSSRILVTLMRFFRARLVGTLMATSPLFHPFSDDERRALVNHLRVRELSAQEIILRQGRAGDGLYVVLIGTLVVFVSDRDGRSRKLGVLGPGDVFGEMSLIRSAPAMASIGSQTRSWILRLPVRDFTDMVSAHPEVLQRLEDIAAVRDARNQAILDGLP